jgi:hypothetical protein
MASTSGKFKFFASWLRWAAVGLVCGILFLRPGGVACETVIGSEYDVKIGFIYNFVNFVTWPAEAFEKSPGELIFCFASDTPSADVLYKLDGKPIKGRKIKVIAFRDSACLEESHVIFFATQDKTFIQKVLASIGSRSILTIGEVEGFTRMGGVINFFQEQNRLRFQVNIDAARKVGLKMSSQLLGSARIVNEERK